DLFLSDADEFFDHMAMRLVRGAEPSERVTPVREMLEHVGGEAHTFQAALVASGKWHDMLELAQAHFARGIELRFEQLARSRSSPAESRKALATACSGAFLALL